MRVLITGVGGFAGSHLADYVLARPETGVWGAELTARPPDYLDPDVRMLAVDLRDPQAVRRLIRTARPDRIFHLAGQAFVPQSHVDPWGTLETNLRPQLNLFEALLGEDLRPSMLTVSSYEVYDSRTPREGPVDETWPLGPDSPYGVSKVAQDFLARQYFEKHGLPVIRVRPFNHIGPRQNDRFVATAFARQVARIEAGLQPPVLKVGDLSARRDFTDVRDVVRAYALLLEHGEPGQVYNVGSGRIIAVRDLLEGLLALAGADITVEVDPARLRPSDTPAHRCDASKARATTGWEPQIPLEQTLRDLLDYERTLTSNTKGNRREQ